MTPASTSSSTREQQILDAEGLAEWSVKDGVDGYCWRHNKTLQRIAGDLALFLHEVAHALCDPCEGDQHHGIWAGHFTDLVRKYTRTNLVLEPPRDHPEIVCLCGSTRFLQAFREANRRLTLEGKIVLAGGCDTKAEEPPHMTGEQKQALDALHLHKIDLADRVLVLNVGGYLGYSTLKEIDYARSLGKPVEFLETPGAHDVP